MGDLNYRLEFPRRKCERLIRSCSAANDYSPLLARDQLSRVMKQNKAFHGLSEAPITFAPTFKFDKGTMNYDSSEKQRVPSYTDRILYTPNGVVCNRYSSIPGNEGKEDWERLDVVSDHKAVYAEFTAERLSK